MVSKPVTAPPLEERNEQSTLGLPYSGMSADQVLTVYSQPLQLDVDLTSSGVNLDILRLLVLHLARRGTRSPVRPLERTLPIKQPAISIQPA